MSYQQPFQDKSQGSRARNMENPNDYVVNQRFGINPSYPKQSEQYAVQMPQGNSNFQYAKKKHFQSQPTELQRMGSLENPYDQPLNPESDKPYYPRNLNVTDIEGAGSGSLPSPVIRNKENARKVIEKELEEKKLLQDQNGKLFQDYMDSIDKFRYDLNSVNNGGEYKDRHQLALNSENPYAFIDHPRYNNNNQGAAPQENSIGRSSILKPHKVQQDPDFISSKQANNSNNKGFYPGKNENTSQISQDKNLPQGGNNDKLTNSKNFQLEDKKLSSQDKQEPFQNPPAEQLQNSSNANINNYPGSQQHVGKSNSISQLYSQAYPPNQFSGAYGRMNPTSMSYGGGAPRTSLPAQQYSISNQIGANDKQEKNGQDPFRRTKTMLGIQKFEKFAGEFQGVGMPQNQGSQNPPNLHLFQRVHPPVDTLGMVLKNPSTLYMQGERNLDHYKKEIAQIMPKPKDNGPKSYSQHEKKGNILPLGAPFSYNPMNGQSQNGLPLLNHQKQLEKLELSLERADKTYENVQKYTPLTQRKMYQQLEQENAQQNQQQRYQQEPQNNPPQYPLSSRQAQQQQQPQVQQLQQQSQQQQQQSQQQSQMEYQQDKRSYEDIQQKKDSDLMPIAGKWNKYDEGFLKGRSAEYNSQDLQLKNIPSVGGKALKNLSAFRLG